MDTKNSLGISVEGQSDDSLILQPFSLTGYVDKQWADPLRIGTTFNCFTSQSGPQLAIENIQKERISHSEAYCRKIESLDSIMSAYALSPSAAVRFLKLLPIDLSFTTDNSTSSTEKRNHFLYSHIIQKERKFVNTIRDTTFATEFTHYVDSVVYGGYMFVHLTSEEDDIDQIKAENIMKSGISYMGRQAGLSASKKNHSDATKNARIHHIISSIPSNLNVFSQEGDIIERFVSKYNTDAPDLTPISFHFVALPGAKLNPYFKFSQMKFERLSRDVEVVKEKMKSLISIVDKLGTKQGFKKMVQLQSSIIQELSDEFTELENNFHVKGDCVKINPKEAVQKYNLQLENFREQLEDMKDVGKDVGELSTLQAYFEELESCAGISEAKDAIGRLIMKKHTVTGKDGKKVILLIGKVGQGKSSVGNYLTGQDLFDVRNSSKGATQKIKEGCCTGLSEKNETLIVYDTPGFLDEKHHSKVATSKIKSEWSTGVHAFVWVLRSDLHDDVDRVLNKLKQRLFEGITEHMIIAFTFCEDPSFTIQGLLEKNEKLRNISDQVDQRVIGIRSKNPSDVHNYERQETLKALLNLVNIIDNKKGKYKPPSGPSCVVM